MALVQHRDGHWQEVRPSCCGKGHPWTRPGSYRVIGHHVRSWQCTTCGDVISTGKPLRLDYPEPLPRG